MLRIAIIIGSTRPGRKGEAVANWVYEVAQQRNDAEFELVDIKDFNLPLLDEPVSPTLGQYSKPHSLPTSRTSASSSRLPITRSLSMQCSTRSSPGPAR
jgi:NAD(P)H-dependent FMN reductase